MEKRECPYCDGSGFVADELSCGDHDCCPLGNCICQLIHVSDVDAVTGDVLATTVAYRDELPDVPDVIVLTMEEFHAAADARLKDLDMTYEQLKEEAELGNFRSVTARKLWYFIGGTR